VASTFAFVQQALRLCIRCRTLAEAGMTAQTVIPTAKVALLPLALGLSVLAGAAWAQSGPLDQPHVVPRIQPDSGTLTASISEPSLRPRTKPMRVDVDLVLVPVTVTDALNRPVIDLPRQNFELYEGGVAQPIRYFSNEDAPISVGLILDCSGSMRNKIDYEREALAEFFKYANPQDDYFAISVSSHPEVIATSEKSIETIQAKLGETEPKGGTALYDAVYLGIARMSSARYQRKALVIITDGGDNRSRYSLKETQRMVEEADVLTYGIGIFDDVPVHLFKTFEERWGRKWLSQITDATGGRTIAADNRKQIPEIAALISRELRNQYVLGYRPTNKAHDGKWRRLQVLLTPSAAPLHVHYKQGYVAPEE
jgi:Ca-activated chloride channel homolog